MKESEYKIRTIIRSERKVKVSARFNDIERELIPVTAENHDEYPMHQIGDEVEHIKRTRYSTVAEWEFPAVITDDEIKEYLYEKALEYGQPVN